VLQECLRGPARERDGVVPRQAGDVDEPDDCLDADGGADADHELAELLVGEVTADAVERFGDPRDRASLAEGQSVSFCGVGLEGEAQHSSLLGLGVEDHGAEVADDGIEPGRRVLRRVRRKHRRGGDLRVRRHKQRALGREVAVRGRPRDGGRGRGSLNRRRDAGGDEVTRGGDQGVSGPGLLG
jgi:hypothetical protein